MDTLNIIMAVISIILGIVSIIISAKNKNESDKINQDTEKKLIKIDLLERNVSKNERIYYNKRCCTSRNSWKKI